MKNIKSVPVHYDAHFNTCELKIIKKKRKKRRNIGTKLKTTMKYYLSLNKQNLGH